MVHAFFRLLAFLYLLGSVRMGEAQSVGTALSPASTQISLHESLLLALQSNKGLQRARLTHSLKDWPVRLAEGEFKPRLRIRSGADASRQRIGGERASAASAAIAGDVDMLLATGARVSVGASETASDLLLNGSTRERLASVQLTQPLLRGAGKQVAQASLASAQISEQVATLSLRDATANLVIQVIRAYRAVVLTNQQLNIARRSLERSQQQSRTSELLVEAGRQPAFELIQARSDVAQRQFDESSAQLAQANARAALASLTGLPRESNWSLIQESAGEPVQDQDWLSVAFQNRSDWQAAALALRAAEISLTLAENAKLPAADLAVRVSRRRGGSGLPASEVGVQLTLDLPVRDVGLDQAFATAKVALEQAQLDKEQIADNIRADVADTLDQVRSLQRQVELAKSATKLASQQLKNETLRFSEGRSAAFQVKQIEDALVASEVNLANTETGYLNALLDLDRAVGKTLERWGIGQ